MIDSTLDSRYFLDSSLTKLGGQGQGLHLELLLSVGDSDPLSADVGWVEEVLEDGVVDGGQGSGPGSGLGLVDLDPSGEDGPLSGEESGESLLLLDGGDERKDIGLGGLEGWVGDVDEEDLVHNLSVGLDGHLSGLDNLNSSELALSGLGSLDEIVDNACDLVLNLSGFSLTLNEPLRL